MNKLFCEKNTTCRWENKHRYFKVKAKMTWWWPWCHFVKSCYVSRYVWTTDCGAIAVQSVSYGDFNCWVSHSHELIRCFLQYDNLKVHLLVHFPRRNPSRFPLATTPLTIRSGSSITLPNDSIETSLCKSCRCLELTPIYLISPEYYWVLKFYESSGNVSDPHKIIKFSQKMFDSCKCIINH